jgi:hypothetical protein
MIRGLHVAFNAIGLLNVVNRDKLGTKVTVHYSFSRGIIRAAQRNLARLKTADFNGLVISSPKKPKPAPKVRCRQLEIWQLRGLEAD